jgi:hypothetical protein
MCVGPVDVRELAHLKQRPASRGEHPPNLSDVAVRDGGIGDVLEHNEGVDDIRTRVGNTIEVAPVPDQELDVG